MMNHRLPELNELFQRKNWLEKCIGETEERLNNAPEGSVRIIRHGNGLQFFHRTRPEDTSGVYLPVSELSKAKALVQKRYDQKVIKEARRQYDLLEHFLEKYDPDALKRVFEECGELRKPFIEAWELPDKEFKEAWETVVYEQKPFREGTAEHYTDKNGFFPGENLIITFETTKRPLNLSDVNMILRHYFL